MRNQAGCHRPRSWPRPGHRRSAPAMVAGNCFMDNDSSLISFEGKLEVCPTPNGRSADKVDKFKWKPLGARGEFRWINKKIIQIDASYQRTENKPKVLEIAANWSWESCSAISVMERACGTLVAVDGQHRLSAAWRRSDIVEVPCMVFKSCGNAQEAEAFIELNTNRKPVSAFSKYRAKLVAGDPVAIEITKTVTSLNLSICENGDTPGTLTCVATTQKLFASNSERFRRVIAIAAELSEQDNTSVHRILLEGLFYIDQRVAGGLRDARLLSRIYQVGAKALVESALKMSYRVGKGGYTVWVDGMMEVLNRSMRNKFKLNT